MASNELEGRGTGQPGNDMAAEYIADIFRGYGLEPAGDDGTYFQDFTLRLKNGIGAGTQLAIGTQGRSNRRRLVLNEDFVPLPFSETGEFSGEVVFAGYGVVNGSLGYDDYADLEVADKIVLILRGAPAFAGFTNDDKSFRTKASKANARDAAAILVVNAHTGGGEEGAEQSDRLYKFDQESRGFFGFGRENYGIPMLHVTRASADRLLAAAGMPGLASLQRQIEKGGKPVSAPLAGVSVRGAVEIVPVETPVRNVVAMIPGTGPNADEIIILGAHYDHVGVTRKGEPNFDPEKHILNGADDNASGTAMLMTMAKAYTEGPRPNRSVLLIAFTAEEIGLLGSGHFIRQPTVDLDKCIAMINFDMVGRLKDDRLEVGGLRTGGFEEISQRIAEKYDLEIREGGGGAGPSDHAAFYAKGIPVLFLFTGIHRQYHQPTDDVGLINADGAMRIARYAADVIDEIDAAPERPVFQRDERPEVLLTQIQGDDGEGGDEGEIARVPSRPRNRVRLGVEIETEDGPGVQIGGVAENSPAARAGIKKGDRIVKMGSSPIETTRDVFRALRAFKDGDSVTVGLQRKGSKLNLEVHFGRPEEKKPEKDSFERAGEELIALARRLQDEWRSGESGSAITYQRGGELVVVRAQFEDSEDAFAFLEQISDVLMQLPDGKELKVGFSVGLTWTSPGAAAAEVELRLERSGQAVQPEAEKKPDARKKPKERRRTSWAGISERAA